MGVKLNLEHWKSMPGPDDVHRFVLENGIVVLCRQNLTSPSVQINGYLTYGSMFDPPEQLGLAQFTTLGLMKGTQKRSFSEIYDALESVGASLGLASSVHTTSFSGRALAEDLPLLLSILQESITQPTFPPDQIERLRAQYVTGLEIRDQSTEDMASMTFDQMLFPNHPYGLPVDGYANTVKAISRDDLVEFHRRHAGPRGMVIAIVSNLAPEEALHQVQDALGGWNNPEQIAEPSFPAVSAPTQTRREHVELAGKSQSDLVMGTLGPRRNDDDYVAASLGNNVLGQFGMFGRIGEVVREQSGLAYYASTHINASSEAGSWEVSAGVNPANLDRAIELIIGELRRFTREPVSLEELEDTQSYYLGRLPMQLESNAGVAGALINIERYQLGLDYYRRYPQMVLEVTPEKVLEAARRYIEPDKLYIATAGSRA
ncbi:M16 family metallopeptidase [Ornatilinea apprima]|nr:pitrilysin family protein [Ornatilinea apprima]